MYNGLEIISLLYIKFMIMKPRTAFLMSMLAVSALFLTVETACAQKPAKEGKKITPWEEGYLDIVRKQAVAMQQAVYEELVKKCKNIKY